MQSLTIQLVQFDSPEYHETVELREKILRKPLGLKFDAEELKAEGNQFHIAGSIDGKIVGCMCLVPLDAKKLKMRQVAVDDSMQGQGIGTRLVSFAEEFAIKKGFCCIELHARKVSKAFYDDLAYSTIGEEFTEVGIPHYKMEKNWCS
ncbi:MAG: GNAT family N-acetyltransferase [Bacteroidota bacterium]|nr:GNAT family N-acetyltransferase [Bacteroidota bacterium]MDX5429610.1 GNAT family N-acetyltransferase [Bacteroidota bacterium]MDX5468394.1 GNAT family N-acetyltransferase [Bacteroidota bacterium]